MQCRSLFKSDRVGDYDRVAVSLHGTIDLSRTSRREALDVEKSCSGAREEIAPREWKVGFRHKFSHAVPLRSTCPLPAGLSGEVLARVDAAAGEDPAAAAS